MQDSTPLELDHPVRDARWRTLLLLAFLLVPVLWLTVTGWDDEMRENARLERYRREAEQICRENARTYVKYPLADERDPAPHMTPFEYCVAAHMSHIPGPE